MKVVDLSRVREIGKVFEASIVVERRIEFVEGK